MTLPVKLRDARQSHLEQLVSEQAREGPHLEFKRELPGAWTSDVKQEFLADVVAFANSGGGDLVFGIEEDGDARAAALRPSGLGDVDFEVRRLQDFLLNSVEPRLPGVEVHAITVSSVDAEGPIFVVRVPQSWASSLGQSGPTHPGLSHSASWTDPQRRDAGEVG
jgi:predicted HTH transcriptional regulator